MNKNERKKQFAKNLKRIMVEMGLKPMASVLEPRFNLQNYGKDISPHGVAKWLRGESLPSYDKMITLAKVLNVQPNELQPDFKLKEEKQIKQEKIGYQNEELCKAFLSLSVEQKKIVREIILSFAQNNCSEMKK